MNLEEALDRKFNIEEALDRKIKKESSLEKALGEFVPTVKVPITPELKPIPKIDLQSKTHPESFIGRQMKGMEASLGLSKEEFDILETEIISQENRDSFVESVGEVTALAGQPYDIAKGASAFIMAGIPTFLLGIGGAVSEMNKELPQLFAGYSNLLDMADAAERGFNKVAEYMQPGKEKVEDFLEFPRGAFKGAFGEPLSELLLGKPVDSDLVGEIAMVPGTAAQMPFDIAAESEKVKTVAKVAKKIWLDKVFITEDNIRGALKFAGFFAFLAGLHKVYRGKPGVVRDPLKRSVIKDVKEVTEKAEKIAETEMLVEKTPDAAIRSAQEKILKMEKQQLELEAKKIAEDLKKEVDVEDVVKKDLKKKGKKVEEIKSGLRTAEERQVEIERAFKEKEVAPEKGIEIPKELTPDLAEKVKYEGVQKKLVKSPTGERIEKPAFHQFRDKKTGSSFIIPFGEDINAGVLKKLQGLEKRAKIEPKVGGGKPPIKGLVVANIGADGKIYYGEFGELHYNLYNRYPNVIFKDIGFSDSSGKYLTRAEALKKADIKIPEGFEKYVEREGLEAMVYLRAKAIEEGMDPVTGKPRLKVEPEPILEIDRQTGTSIPTLEGEKSPFFQTKEEADAMAKVYEGRNIVDAEVFTMKLVNDVNRWFHGDKAVDIDAARKGLSDLAVRAKEIEMAFDNPADFRAWQETVSEAAIWARRDQAKPSIGYHGTSTKFLPGIEQKGLRPISMKQIVENVLDELNLKGVERDKVRQKIYEYDYFDETIKGTEGTRPFDEPELYIAKDIEFARNSAEWAGEAYDSALIAAGAFDKPGGKFNRAISNSIAKKAKSLYEKNRSEEPIVLEVEVPGDLKKGDNIYRDQLKYKVVEPLRSIKKQREGVELYSGIDPTKILDVIKKIRRVTPEIISEYEEPSMLKYHPETAREIKTKIAKERRVAIREPKTFEDFGPLDGKKIEFIHHIKHKYSKTLKQAKDIADAFYEGELDAEGVKAMLAKEAEGIKLYSGLPLDAAQKLILEGAKRAKEYMDDARRAKRIRPVRAAKIGYEAAIRELVDKSGNIKWDFIDKLGLKGYEIVQKLVLTKGANTIAANKLKQMSREIYGGLTRIEKCILDNLIMYIRLLDIAGSKTVKEFNWPIHKKSGKQLTPADAISYIETFPYLEGITPERARVIRRRAEGYSEWMKRPLEDLLKAELISQTEYDDLVSHKYRRIKLIDIFDKKYESKRGRKPLTVYDSGVQELARGRKTDIYEPSSEIMALEVFNRSYGRIMRQKANKALLELAKSDPKNPFVRTKDGKGGIPSGWQRIFVFDKGERKALYVSEQMSKEWLTSSSELPYKYGMALQWFSGSAVLRTFATGISWGFALRNIPRDIMHIYYAARVWEDGKWKSAYSPHLPIFLPQIGMDIARVLPDVIVRGKKTQDYFDYGGGMEFLVHQGLLLRKGKHLEPGLSKPLKLLSWFGETSELTTRVAVKEHITRRRARERGLTVEEARKDKDIQRESTFVARDYLDFNQGGGMMKAANNAFPYLTARIQASRGMWRTAKDNPKEFLYKVFEMGAATTLLYSAMREQAPETTKALQGSMDLQNNLCIPVGDNFGFEDEKGQMRYWGFKIPLDGGQRFFKAFFEASYDKFMGHEVDVDRVIGALKEMSPVDISAFPPTASGAIGYLWNEDLWRGKDVWRETKKPFKYELPEWAGGPEVGGSKEEYIPGETSEFMTDVGKYTGISPERGQFVAEELVTSNSEWFYLLGKGYEKLFADVPKEKVEQQWAEVLMRERENQRLGKIVTGLKEAPIIGSFIFVTNPYSKYAGKIEEDEGRFAMTRFVENRELDRLSDGYLFEESHKKEDVVKYYKSFKDIDTRERLRKRFDFQVAIRKLPERSFWLRLRSLAPEIRASRYYDRLQSATPEEHERLMREKSIVTKAGGFFTENFWLELRKIRREKE